MTKIESFVFFDIETTGLPFQERNQTKIIELSLLATSRKQIEQTKYGNIPAVQKLTSLLNPGRKIHPEVTKITGLSNKLVKSAPKFDEKVNDLVKFLEALPEPVCLVAHNGNSFDFKLIHNEFLDANEQLPHHLLCVDSLIGFRRILSNSGIDYMSISKQEELLSDDEEEEEYWPELNLTSEDWDGIDKLASKDNLSNHTKNIYDKEYTKTKPSCKERRTAVIKKVFNIKNKVKESFTLSSIYKRLLNKEPENAHQAEADCLMLLECVVAVKDFLTWADNECKLLRTIKPYQRY